VSFIQICHERINGWRRRWRRLLGDRTVEWCHRCGRTVELVWYADDVLWNEVSGNDGVLCARCFDRRCAARGVILTWEPRELVP
jgi:hypothetical protein